MKFTLDPITPEAIALNKAFMQHQPEPGEARRRAAQASAAAAERAAAGVPLAEMTEMIIQQDEVSGLLMAGERTVTLPAVGEPVVGEAIFPLPPSEEERAVAARARFAGMVVDQRNEAVGRGIDTPWGTVDVGAENSRLIGNGMALATSHLAIDTPYQPTTIQLVGGGATDPLGARDMVNLGLMTNMAVAAMYDYARPVEKAILAAETAEDAQAIAIREGVVDE